MKKPKIKEDRRISDWFPYFGGKSYCLRNPEIEIFESTNPAEKKHLKELERRMQVRTSYLAVYNGLIFSTLLATAIIIGLEKYLR